MMRLLTAYGKTYAGIAAAIVAVVMALAVLGLAVLSVLSRRRPTNLGVTQGRLAPCPSTPNAVCSDDAGDPTHAIAPISFSGDPRAAWQRVRLLVAALPRATIVNSTDDYLHAETRSRLFRFIDDLELHLRPEEQIIAVRSAARVGHSDLGANRARVERLRRDFAAGS